LSTLARPCENEVNQLPYCRILTKQRWTPTTVFSALRCLHPVNPFGTLFAYVPASGAQKVRQPSGPGHGPFTYRGFHRLHQPQRATLFCGVARPTAGWFSPDGGGPEEREVAPGGQEPVRRSAGEPLNRGKTKGSAWVMAGLAPAISARFFIGFSRGVQNVCQL
jgi:hypothetical protein